MDFVFVSQDFVERVKSLVKKAEGDWAAVGYELRRKAEEAMIKGPWSVTFTPSPAASGNPHDYFSEGPYWWPNPEDPTGPYIRRDGENNPDRFDAHKSALKELCNTLLYLCSGGYYLEEKRYLERAAELVRVWFINPETRMNPHLEYGQAIRGICEGRGIGIIELQYMDVIIHSLGFLGISQEWKKEMEGVRSWVSDMLTWMTTSQKGIEESENGNNHASWWAVHVAAFASFTDNRAKLEEAFTFFKDVILPSQMVEDGSFPKELARTRSFHYSLFNLDACGLLCEIAYLHGIDLWNYQRSDGRGMKLGVKYVLPYMDNPFLWKYKEIDGEVPDENLALQLAALRLDMKECIRLNKKRRGESYYIRNQKPLGPLVLLPGSPLI